MPSTLQQNRRSCENARTCCLYDLAGQRESSAGDEQEYLVDVLAHHVLCVQPLGIRITPDKGRSGNADVPRGTVPEFGELEELINYRLNRISVASTLCAGSK